MRKSDDNLEAHNEKKATSAEETFAELYQQYLPKVFRYINFRVGNNKLAEDLTSLVFEKALTKINTYRSDKASLPTWLFSIAGNTVTDHYRQSSRRQTISLDEAENMISQDPSPEDQVIREEERQKLHLCLARLSRQEQEIISFKFGAELTNRRIAGLLGLSESNVGTILYRAVRKLRDSFNEA